MNGQLVFATAWMRSSPTPFPPTPLAFEVKTGTTCSGPTASRSAWRFPVEHVVLRIDFTSPGFTCRWIEERSNFPYWPGGMQATEHWILRMKDVELPRAERATSIVLPGSLAHSIASGLPRVWHTLSRAAGTIDDAHCRVLDPIWFDSPFLLGAWDWANSVGPRCFSGQPGGPFTDNRRRWMELHHDDIPWLRGRSDATNKWRDNSVFESAFPRNEDAKLFVADLAAVKRRQVWDRQQTMLELHRGICESLETVIRARFNDTRLPSTRQQGRSQGRQRRQGRQQASGFARVFKDWVAETHKPRVAEQWGSLERWDTRVLHEGAIQQELPGAGDLSEETPRLEDLIDSLLRKCGRLKTLEGKDGLGNELQRFWHFRFPVRMYSSGGMYSTASAWIRI